MSESMDITKRRWNDIQRRCKERGPEVCSLDEFRAWYESQPRVCSYCGIEEEFMRRFCTTPPSAKSLHVDRMENRKGYFPGNMALACYSCNTVIKKTRSKDFIKVVIDALKAHGMLDEYHLWNVPEEARPHACLWHQFADVYEVERDGKKLVRYEAPNSFYYESREQQ